MNASLCFAVYCCSAPHETGIACQTDQEFPHCVFFSTVSYNFLSWTETFGQVLLAFRMRCLFGLLRFPQSWKALFHVGTCAAKGRRRGHVTSLSSSQQQACPRIAYANHHHHRWVMRYRDDDVSFHAPAYAAVSNTPLVPPSSENKMF